MDATFTTTWCNCNEETQWHYGTSDNSNNNNSKHSDSGKGNSSATVYTSSVHINSNNRINNNNNINNNKNIINNNNNNNTDTQAITFNQSKTAEVRQTRLQRQRELQQSPASLQNLSPLSNAFEVKCGEKSTLSSSNSSHQPPTHRVPRRKRVQRQKPTEVDDVDFAYAADLEEEEDEEEEDKITMKQQQKQQQQQQPITNIINANPLVLSSTRSEQVTTPTFANKCLQHFQQQLHITSSTPFDGQPSSLPNDASFAAATSASSTSMGFQQHHQHQHHQQHQYHQHQQLHYQQPHRERRLKHEESFDSSTTTTTNTTDTATSPASPLLLRRHNFSLLKRDNSMHSDSSSHYSSVDSLLEARKPDPEAILINLGFGPVGSEDILSRIPKRFLKPSQVRGIDTEAFIRRLQLASNLADHSVLGYRGLTGNPDIPPSRIVAKIMQRFEVNERKKSMGSIEQTI